MRWQRSWVIGFVLPVVFLLVCRVFGITELSFDVLERSYLIEHPSECLQGRNGSPTSHFLFYAHMLELPLAWFFGLRWLGLSGSQSLVVFESFCGAASVYITYRLVRLWGGGVVAALVAQVVLMTSLSFWRMSSGGEERISGLASQLGFLWAFWHTLATGRRAGLVAVTLALSILVHLSGLVLLPFAALALALRRFAPLEHAGRVMRQVVLGTVAAGVVFVAVGALTAGARTPGALFDYATLYHRQSGINFFELTSHEPAAESRLQRVVFGMGHFFGVVPWGKTALAQLAGLLAFGVWWHRRRRSKEPVTGSRAKDGEWSSPDALRILALHSFIVAALWTLHFAFYRPASYESWTLPLAVGIVVAAVLWSSIFPAILLVLPLTFVPGNWSYMGRLHREDSLHALRTAVQTTTAPGDVIMLHGSRVDGVLTEGSLHMRYALAFLGDRRVVSLHDVLRVGDGEYWRPYFQSPAELQAAIDAGTKVYSPGWLAPIYAELASTGALEVAAEWAAPGLLRVKAFRPLGDYAFTPEQLSLGALRAKSPDAPPPP